EVLIIDRMVFHFDREALVARHEARPLGDGPALKHAVEFEAEVVMQAPRRVLLDHEGIAARLRARAARLARFGEGALGHICLQTGHASPRLATIGTQYHPRAAPAASLPRVPSAGTRCLPRQHRAANSRRQWRAAPPAPWRRRGRKCDGERSWPPRR